MDRFILVAYLCNGFSLINDEGTIWLSALGFIMQLIPGVDTRFQQNCKDEKRQNSSKDLSNSRNFLGTHFPLVKVKDFLQWGRLKEIVCFASKKFENWTRARENKTQTPEKNTNIFWPQVKQYLLLVMSLDMSAGFSLCFQCIMWSSSLFASI